MSFNPLEWGITPRVHLGSLSISPHGVGIMLGYLLGAHFMAWREKRKVDGLPENHLWKVLFWALVGAIIGARVGYVIGHVPEVTDSGKDLLGLVRIWEGGISLLGGIGGAVIVGLPYVWRNNLGAWRTFDAIAPGLAFGIVIGRIGDLMIGDHLGRPTSFPLAWRCTGASGTPPIAADAYRAALERGTPPAFGCYDIALHQTALYDLISTLALLGVLLYLGRKVRHDGFMAIVFVVWYGTMRMFTDFLRVDRRYLGLTGSQVTSLLVGAICLYLLVRYRGAPPRWRRSGTETSLSTTESEQETAISPSTDHAP